MADTYTRQRLDGLADDVAATRSLVEHMDKNLSRVCGGLMDQDARLKKVERRVFAIWLLGPVLLGLATFLKTFTGR